AEAQTAPPVIAWPRAPGHWGARSGQLLIKVRATAVARPCSRMMRAIRIASPTDPPCEDMRTGRRRPPRSAITLAKAPAVPGLIVPSAEIHSGQLGSHAGSELVTRTMRMAGSPRGRGGSLRSASATVLAVRKTTSAIGTAAAAPDCLRRSLASDRLILV